MALAVLIGIVCLPIVEIYLAIQVAHQIGGLGTVALLIMLSASGPWLVKRQGLGVWQRARQRIQDGEMPGREMVDGIVLLAAGLLLTVPGFLTAAFGIVLLLPPVRALLRGAAGAWLVRKARDGRVSVRVHSDGRWHGPGGPAEEAAGRPIDVGVREAEGRDGPADPSRPGLPPARE